MYMTDFQGDKSKFQEFPSQSDQVTKVNHLLQILTPTNLSNDAVKIACLLFISRRIIGIEIFCGVGSSKI